MYHYFKYCLLVITIIKHMDVDEYIGNLCTNYHYCDMFISLNLK